MYLLLGFMGKYVKLFSLGLIDAFFACLNKPHVRDSPIVINDKTIILNWPT